MPRQHWLTLSHSPAITLPSSFTHIAINIAITKAPHNTPGLPAPEINILSKAHHTSTQAKCVCTNPNIVANLNSEGMFHFPFTIDHLGGIGHHFHHFLYPPDSLLLDPEPPLFTDPNDFPHLPAYVAHMKAAGKWLPSQQHKSSSFLPTAAGSKNTVTPLASEPPTTPPHPNNGPLKHSPLLSLFG
jgi:hypothetical protein